MKVWLGLNKRCTKFIISPINWLSAMKPFFKDHPLMTPSPNVNKN